MHRHLAFYTIPFTVSLLSATALAAQPSSRLSDTALVRAVDSLVQHAIVRGITPGFGLSVVRNGHVLTLQAYGMAQASRGIRVTAQTRWYLASTSKSLTGFAMALLADRGTLPFSTSVRDALPGSTWHSGVVVDSLTIAQLLSHTHNLTDNVIVVSSAFTGAIPEPQWPSLLLSVPAAKRAALIYSNFGYNVAGMILDRRTRGGWRAFLDSAVLRPAGMRHATARLSSVPSALLAMPHDYASVSFTTMLFDKRDQTMHAAGGHVATLDDMARWVQIHLDSGVVDGQRVFPATAVRLAHTLIATHTESRGKRYAYFDREGWSAGWDIGRYDGEPMVSRFGGFATMRSHLSFLPARRVGVVAMSNGGLGSSLTDVVAAYIYDLDRGRPDAATRAWTRVDSLHTNLPEARRAALLADSLARAQERMPPSVPIGTLLGRYASPTLGTLIVVRNGPSIAVRWGVLAAPVRTVDASDGTYRVAGGGTEFSLRFEWIGDAGGAPATAAVVNGSVMRRVK
ncbi:serine hydrolase domain-containing protein [Gemmatimonas sp.]|uniref:serine hydrolase domain-containing protein n=2 Tax=Gemmatimonas sp. TaxID=1962908 RepID=UPI0035643142